MEPKSQYLIRKRKNARVRAGTCLGIASAIILLLINKPPQNIWNAVFLGVVASVLALSAWFTAFTTPDSDDIRAAQAQEARQ